MTGKFAKDAILAQPFDYLRVVTQDTLHTFGWNRQPDPDDYWNGNGARPSSSCPARTLTSRFPGWHAPSAVGHPAGGLL